MRQLPPAPSTKHLQRLSVAALRDLLLANGVMTGPRTRKNKLCDAVLRLVANPGSSIRLPAGLSRASEGVPVPPAISHDAVGPGEAAPTRTHDDEPRRAALTSQPAGANPRNGEPNGAPPCPLRAHGASVDASGLAAELPAMPHRAPAYPADPDCGKLSAAVRAAMEGLPLRPSAEQLRGTKFAGLQTLLKTNGLPRPSHASVESMTDQLCAWLAEQDGRVVELPRGVERQGRRPLGGPEPPHRAGRSAASDRRNRNMSPHLCDGPLGTAAARADEDFPPFGGARVRDRPAPRRS